MIIWIILSLQRKVKNTLSLPLGICTEKTVDDSEVTLL
uniref:Uncharacterized protein n=1 Tax=Arundo donax TaxID=35708 RepID=A0A0A9AH38_ARUDO